MEALILIPVAIAAIIIIRLAAGGMDRNRIDDYIASRGGKVIDSNWAPLGPGWFGEKSDRIYGVRFLDADGNEHEAHCKTSLLTGVYLTEDRIVRYAERRSDEGVSLEEENRRLREEVERLRRGYS